MSGFKTVSDTNWSGQPKKLARSLKFQIEEDGGFYYPYSENKDAVTKQLICDFDFAYKCRLFVFPCDCSFINWHIILKSTRQLCNTAHLFKQTKHAFGVIQWNPWVCKSCTICRNLITNGTIGNEIGANGKM